MNISNLPNYARDHVGKKSRNDADLTAKSQIDDCLYSLKKSSKRNKIFIAKVRHENNCSFHNDDSELRKSDYWQQNKILENNKYLNS